MEFWLKGYMCNCFHLLRYNSETGTFTVPINGEGYYFLSFYLTVYSGKIGFFDIQINGATVCGVVLDQQETSFDVLQSSCSAVTSAAQGSKQYFFVHYKKHNKYKCQKFLLQLYLLFCYYFIHFAFSRYIYR